MHRKHFLALALAAAFAAPASAAVSADEAAKLKTTLTPLGAERAGNKDGSIPAWDGGLPATSPATRGPTRSRAKSRCCRSAPRTWRSTRRA
jgi:hypothetical protein